ncbi:MAG: peptidylprolyl isomerase [Halobacteriaceae archaeon]
MSDEPEESAADDAADEAAEEASTERQAADESEAEPETEVSGLQEGDFVRLAYTARTVEDGDLVDTTDPDVAEEADVDTEGQTFEPRVLVLGAGQMFESVEDDILGKEVGDSGAVTVPAGEAFGEYDPDDVRTVSADRIPEDDRYPGAHVDLDGEHGHVETIIGGRARVDFNHPLAGEDIEYEYEILEQVEDRVEQAQGMLQTYFDVSLEMWIETDEVEEEVVVESEEDADEDDEESAEPETETELVEKETLYIESNPQLQFNQQWMFSKQQILEDVMDRIDVDRVVIQEIVEPQAGMMGGMGGMMGGMGGGDLGDIEEAIEDVDVDADEIAEELDDVDLED